jgi:hypothetical protein
MSGFSPKFEELKKSSPHYLKVFSGFAVVLPLLLLQFVACLDFFVALMNRTLILWQLYPSAPPLVVRRKFTLENEISLKALRHPLFATP